MKYILQNLGSGIEIQNKTIIESLDKMKLTEGQAIKVFGSVEHDLKVLSVNPDSIILESLI